MVGTVGTRKIAENDKIIVWVFILEPGEKSLLTDEWIIFLYLNVEKGNCFQQMKKAYK